MTNIKSSIDWINIRFPHEGFLAGEEKGGQKMLKSKVNPKIDDYGLVYKIHLLQWQILDIMKYYRAGSTNKL